MYQNLDEHLTVVPLVSNHPLLPQKMKLLPLTQVDKIFLIHF